MDDAVEINRSSGLRRLERSVPFPVGPSTFEDVWSRRTDETIAVIDADRSWTTRELHDEIERVARALTAAGHADGSRLAWVLGNDVGSLISLLATVRVGAVWIGLSDRATNAEREAVIDDAHPDAVFATLPDDAPGVTLPGPPAPTAPAAHPNTTGTTRRPKRAGHTHH
ncbi:MAG: AMP-binding protein, partial [Actinomycetota bacterium]|nr:AMP-binding protein [Actinomycetota bacterium]